MEGINGEKVVGAYHHPAGISMVPGGVGEHRRTAKTCKEHWLWSPKPLALVLAQAVCSWESLSHSAPRPVSSFIKYPIPLPLRDAEIKCREQGEWV